MRAFFKYLGLFACLSLLLIFLFAVLPRKSSVFVHPEGTSTVPPPDANTNTWSSKGKTIWIKNYDGGYAEIPEVIPESILNTTQNDAEGWLLRSVSKGEVEVGIGATNVFWLYGHGGIRVYLAEPDQWTRINCQNGFPVLSKLLGITQEKLAKGAGIDLANLSRMYLGYSGLEMSTSLLHRNDKWEMTEEEQKKREAAAPFPGHIPATRWEWITSDPKKIARLRDLCGETLERKGDGFEYKENLLTGMGAIDHWQVTGEFDKDKNAIITGIVVSRIEPEDTFEFPIRGGFY